MKTAIEIAEKYIAELWSSPSDQPTYTQIFEVLERVKPIFEQQIIDAYNSGWQYGFLANDRENVTPTKNSETYYNDTYTTNKETLK